MSAETQPRRMSTAEYFKALASAWQNQVVICALGTTANEWWNHTQSEGAFYMHAAMGFASSFALGVALSLPGREVWMLDSDGSLSMNLGGLLTEATCRPENLKHFVLSNRCYQSLGGAPLVNAERTDYAAIARGAGIADVWTARTVSELASAVRAVTGSGSFACVVAEVAPSPLDTLMERPPSLRYEGAELKYRFGRYLEAHAGVTVFGPQGY